MERLAATPAVDDTIAQAHATAAKYSLRLRPIDFRAVHRPAVSWETIARNTIARLRAIRNILHNFAGTGDVLRAEQLARRTISESENQIQEFSRPGRVPPVLIDGEQYRRLLAIHKAARALVVSRDVGDLARLALRVDAYETIVPTTEGLAS